MSKWYEIESSTTNFTYYKALPQFVKVSPYEIGQSKPLLLFPYNVSSPVKSKCSTSILLILLAADGPSKGLKKSLTFLLAGKVPSFRYFSYSGKSKYTS